jgi:nucleoside 2-deoxyribosyltransferase
MRLFGNEVHYPPENAPQDDPIGNLICEAHLNAMKECDEVHVFWDVNSKGSHFDLGMAYALGKTIVPMELFYPEGTEKSYWKVMQYWSKL